LKLPYFQNKRQKLGKNYLLVLSWCYTYFKIPNNFRSIKKAYEVLAFLGLKLNIHCTFNELLVLGYSTVDKHENTRKKLIVSLKCSKYI